MGAVVDAPAFPIVVGMTGDPASPPDPHTESRPDPARAPVGPAPDSDAGGGGGAQAAGVRRMGPVGLAWRILAMAAGLAVLTAAQIGHTDDFFPLSAMAMFAQPRDPDGVIDDTCLEGTREGSDEVIPIGFPDAGIARSDVEGNLRSIRTDPQQLAPLARAVDAHHPDAPRLTSLTVCSDRYHLRDGAPDGPPEHVALVTWEAR